MTKETNVNDQPAQGKKSPSLGDFNFAGDDAVVPFEVEDLDARGRAVQLGTAVNSILSRHHYPEPVARLLAEAMVLTVLLGTSLKFDGKFILQTSSDGPVNLLVCDFKTPSSLRAYARFDDKKLEEAVASGHDAPEELLGKGTLALTIDQGEHMQRYQGIVALDGSSLEEIARNYFKQSEQIPTEVKLGVATLFDRDENGHSRESWRAGGVLVQHLPKSSIESQTTKKIDKKTDLDHWREVKALVDTIESSEMTDPQVGAERLLFRLFHEHGVRVFNARAILDQCSCSREKIENVLNTFTAEEINSSIEHGRITVKCEFCSTVYNFNPEEFLKTGQDNVADLKAKQN
ncbi:Hsp33 family molecular chaperone [Bartonella sp. M0283]|uniref:Hsp33 family molecular chaperone n=1 Tax=Bartonella sp. M0283 TaxID=2751016 RepID=UPI0018DD5214|nr:Hsp33 family molecular chaperone [Bartonella sp. M0283]MBI0163605.1 Hsp33 family molecular chaperone [Bartonella sp. M0283]